MIRITEKEIKSVSSLTPLERYRYFIKRVADTELIYFLKSPRGNLGVSELEKTKLFPIWSANEFARQCLVSSWSDFEVQEISLDTFEDEILDFVHSNGYLLNVFPIGDKTGFVVDIVEFCKDLGDEMKNY